MSCNGAAGINPDPVELFRFRSAADVAKWRVFTDATFGGSSRAGLEAAEDGKVGMFV